MRGSSLTHHVDRLVEYRPVVVADRLTRETSRDRYLVPIRIDTEHRFPAVGSLSSDKTFPSVETSFDEIDFIEGSSFERDEPRSDDIAARVTEIAP